MGKCRICATSICDCKSICDECSSKELIILIEKNDSEKGTLSMSGLQTDIQSDQQDRQKNKP